jgi:formamidopyrimidine-DNA glycosylase
MPELPEVETVARGLQREIAGRRILTVTLGKTDFIDNPAEIELHLPTRTIERVERYGKFMLLRLTHPNVSEPSALLVHLGMTGSLMPRAAAEPHTKHTHVVFLLDDGRELRYVDPRRFGRMAFLAGSTLQQELLRFGVDPLESTREAFVTLIAAPTSKLCSSISPSSAVSEIFTLTRVCGVPKFIQGSLVPA